eukprot:Protomagalhaensia_sp_Gyna_25__3469@NODE_3120_length_723_cov_132_463450_g2607_i0_p1_GENE_NODE_3120_length_723_cov_132_463450_g2607_i0NODE_3120_length_723_cov_132_463450_g2607_i0_p1_ORF_typecomplete_len132_score35_55Prefoldin_2/PF01920_20/3e17TLE_N/PF03920_15/2_7e02TLE_N/PF03920_15/0_00037TrmK/PF04816_12/1_2e03TrmK/PF04816_12/0_006RAG1/PF12940_7/0_014RAG1/PF12940_7/5_2e02DUF5392/PF17370_2/0_022PHM7_cyt/PF14703_6/0_21E2R135/PF11570_8/0_48DivIVA/PF05103_13/41DivIVA/PF05103_13/0_19Baculo_PEP_C/PF0451
MPEAVDLDKLRKLSTEYQQLSELLSTHLSSKAKLAAQETENQVVYDELIALEEDAVVYKSVGPVLLKEEKHIAKDTVEKRLKYIRDEMTRLDQVGEQTKAKIEKLAAEISAMQQHLKQQRLD